MQEVIKKYTQEDIHRMEKQVGALRAQIAEAKRYVYHFEEMKARQKYFDLLTGMILADHHDTGICSRFYRIITHVKALQDTLGRMTLELHGPTFIVDINEVGAAEYPGSTTTIRLDKDGNMQEVLMPGEAASPGQCIKYKLYNGDQMSDIGSDLRRLISSSLQMRNMLHAEEGTMAVEKFFALHKKTARKLGKPTEPVQDSDFGVGPKSETP